MIRYPRLAIGSVLPHSCSQLLSWSAMAWFTAGGTQVQHFASRCCYANSGAASVTGRPSRHLDTWLMSAELCLASFQRGYGDSELAIIDGPFDSARADTDTGGGSLDTLCEWLQLPRLAVIDVERLKSCGTLPARPHSAAALLLDRVSDKHDFQHFAQRFADAWGLPTVGAIEDLPRLRATVATRSAGRWLGDELCAELAQQFTRYVDSAAIERLLRTPDLAGEPVADCSLNALHAETTPELSRALTVAVAYDEAFQGYFPEMLDQLEALGATVIDFSPLHDEQLPAEADVVYIGCGNTAKHALGLAQNHCMLTSLRNHLCQGKRLYADGGGLVYLCETCVAESGEHVPLVGVLSAVGRANDEVKKLLPVEVTLKHDCWLAPRGSRLRGYLNSYWTIEPHAPLNSYLAEAEHIHDFVGRYSAIGSRLQLNFATQLELLRGFVDPRPALVPTISTQDLD